MDGGPTGCVTRRVPDIVDGASARRTLRVAEVRCATANQSETPIGDGTERTPEDLVARARRGEVAAFEALLRPHLDRVRRLARAFTRDAADADDLAQDALLRAYRAIGTF